MPKGPEGEKRPGEGVHNAEDHNIGSGGHVVPSYKLYFLAPDGHIGRRLDLGSTHDAAAVREVSRHNDGRAHLELWDCDRYMRSWNAPAHKPKGKEPER